MASQITIIDPSLRRVVIKVLPGKYLSEVRDEACSKLRLDAEQYMLKRNDKQIDLSVTYRLSGLPSGCKLELIQRSKSPSVVTVALQIPAGLAADGLGSRVIHKFSSTVSLWQILRSFESGNVDGSGRTWNFTEQSVKDSSGNEVYAFPRIHVMGRDYTTIEDLQKSLSQLGFNDGTVLLKLDLIPTTKSLPDAKRDMQQYFTSIEPSSSIDEAIVPSSTNNTNEQSSTETIPSTSSITTEQPQSTEPITTTPTIASRPTTVFRPPTSSTPKAALFESADSDFEPSIDLMKQHQASIQSATRNKRLLTDAELEAAASASAAKIATVRSIDIKIVFPDQSSVLAPFTQEDTTKDLYTYVRNLLARPQESFALNYASAKGPIPLTESENKKLISDLELVGRILVRVSWGADAGLEARKGPSLKDDVVKIAKEIEISSITTTTEGTGEASNKNPAKDEKESKKSTGGSSSKVPKWMKLPGKK